MLETAVALALVAVLIGAAEWVDPEEQPRRPRDRRQLRIDLGWLAAYLLYAPLVGWVAGRLVHTADHHSPLAGSLAGRPFVVRLLIAFAAADAVAYLVHRAMHRSTLLWRIHRLHHSATDLHWHTSFRFHPLDTALMHTLPYATAAALGAGPAAIGAYALTVAVVTLFAHADVFVPGRWLARVVVTPGYHRSHHELGRGGTNFALVLPVADLAGRTASFGVHLPRRFGPSR